MTVVFLKDWDAHVRRWMLAVESGELSERPAGQPHGNVGWVSLNARSGAGGTDDPPFCAVYADASHLWFQAGIRRRRLDDGVRFVRDSD